MTDRMPDDYEARVREIFVHQLAGHTLFAKLVSQGIDIQNDLAKLVDKQNRLIRWMSIVGMTVSFALLFLSTRMLYLLWQH